MTLETQVKCISNTYLVLILDTFHFHSNQEIPFLIWNSRLCNDFLLVTEIIWKWL